MKKLMLTSLAAASIFAGVASAGLLQDKTVAVGGAPMYSQKTIVENAINSKDHTTLVAAVKAAGLVDALSSKGPFTVFAPVNSAFTMLPDGTVETLLKPENKDQLVKVLTYHVVSGRYDSASLRKLIRAGGGEAHLKTLAGGQLSFHLNGPANIVVQDENGGVANIPTYDVYQSNGVIHVIDHVLLPR